MKKLIATLALLVAGTATAAWWLRPQTPEWTTDSPRALAEFQQGRSALLQLYVADALGHFQRAAELDPDFVLAKLMVVQTNARGGMVPSEELAVLVEQVESADVSDLTPRERMLVEHFRARLAHDREGAEQVVRAFLQEHPDDPYGVELSCGQSWVTGSPEEAAACYERLIELDPNWVEAQNRLGYLAMARGDFGEAEEQFAKYRYIAPDQANPHDSLGELYALTGRYDEAEREFQAAIAAKSDFCASWANLVLVALLQGDGERAARRTDEARRVEGCSEMELAALECRTMLWGVQDGGGAAAVADRAAECPAAGELLVLRTWNAYAAGREDEVARMEEKVEGYLGEVGEAEPALVAMREHLAGARLLHGGDPGAAAARFRAADEALRYHSQQWLFKLFNRRALADALARAGQQAEADAVRAELAAVNPRFADVPPPPGASAAAR